MTTAAVEGVRTNEMEPTYLAGSVHLYNWWGHNKIISLAILRSLGQAQGNSDRAKSPKMVKIKKKKTEMDLECDYSTKIFIFYHLMNTWIMAII